MLGTPNWENAFTGAICYLALIQIFLFYTILILPKIIFKVVILRGNGLLITCILGSLLIYLINDRYFAKDRRYIEIEEHYKNESPQKKILGNILVIIIALFSLAIFLTSGYFANKVSLTPQ